MSNVVLPEPVATRAGPPQASGVGFPPRGIALVVASVDVSTSPSDYPTPPLSIGMFTEGSAGRGTPTLDTLIFDGDGKQWIATIKTGADASAADVNAVESAVSSFAF